GQLGEQAGETLGLAGLAARLDIGALWVVGGLLDVRRIALAAADVRSGLRARAPAPVTLPTRCVGAALGRRGGAQARAGGAQAVDRIDGEPALLARLLELRAHRKLLEGGDDARRIAPLEARAELAVRPEIVLGRIEIDDEEDAAEQAQELVELV